MSVGVTKDYKLKVLGMRPFFYFFHFVFLHALKEDGKERERREDLRYYMLGGSISIRGFEWVLFLQETRRREQGRETNKGRVRGERARLRLRREERPKKIQDFFKSVRRALRSVEAHSRVDSKKLYACQCLLQIMC